MNTYSINFEAASRVPELAHAAKLLEAWIKSHSNIQFFTIDQLFLDLSSDVQFEQLNRVLLRLVAAGQLDVQYRVKVSDSEYSEDFYDKYEDIPSTVFDSAFEPVDVKEMNKVPAYVPAGSR